MVVLVNFIGPLVQAESRALDPAHLTTRGVASKVPEGTKGKRFDVLPCLKAHSNPDPTWSGETTSHPSNGGNSIGQATRWIKGPPLASKPLSVG